MELAWEHSLLLSLVKYMMKVALVAKFMQLLQDFNISRPDSRICSAEETDLNFVAAVSRASKDFASTLFVPIYLSF